MDKDTTSEEKNGDSQSQSTTHIRWAPLRGIPLERRLQTLATCTWIAMLPICLSAFLLCFIFPVLWPLLIAYVAFLFFDKAPENGGRRFDWPRRWTLWRYFAAYFPVKLIKEHDLDPTQNYVFGYHPHGIISMGAFINFGTEATGFSELFPGIVPSLLTLASNFRLPIYRDIIMALGISSVSRQSCEAILSSEPGRSIVIVIGGAAESLNARPGINDLTLRRRLGFIRMAIRHQAPLVPVFSFGENDLYEQMDNTQGSTIWKVQKKMQSLLGFTLPLFHARGIFNYDVGLVPFRHEIVTVIGKPIPVPKLEKDQAEPTQEQLHALQDEYIKELETIYHKYKDEYAKDRKEELRIID
ncbi:diacylglycerol O-acyltransferase 1 [Apophysomyces sp. BC1034]|nr:diacylglycerol O-acyltransferase 1 [Apophysomyces sp. BC1015]KAG0183063.1 diacylglycerol O-acyltransferase 1 [Apophysomyces sp. BC1021]KAG0194811.1 diacylglycerol O-acyltransferase 1 [Apophysomyces sp. BC1034]